MVESYKEKQRGATCADQVESISRHHADANSGKGMGQRTYYIHLNGGRGTRRKEGRSRGQGVKKKGGREQATSLGAFASPNHRRATQ